ncbi:MAG TPA: DUF1796 family putative cysteine peptidase [Nitrospiraceae bacterium]|nr:DUF1796 family putative cysteine peptidase [Nitrospiraceae bacterium]
MLKPTDLIFSLGPNCKNSWNLRNYFGFERAYPFDWWTTPAKSMLKMIEKGFEFNVRKEDLFITPPTEHNTVYNYKLNVLHHHDFPRTWGEYPGVIFSVTGKDIKAINRKYTFLFNRLFQDVAQAEKAIAVVNHCYVGWEESLKGVVTNKALNGYISPAELAKEVRDRLGKKLRLVFIDAGEEIYEEYGWGWIIREPDNGTRENIKGTDFAEPIHAFRQAYKKLDISLTQKPIEETESRSFATRHLLEILRNLIRGSGSH